jgi:hypothetical protein
MEVESREEKIIIYFTLKGYISLPESVTAFAIILERIVLREYGSMPEIFLVLYLYL